MYEMPFLYLTIVLNAGIIFVPVIYYMISRACGKSFEGPDEPAIPSISRSWRISDGNGNMRDPFILFVFSACFTTIIVMGNICLTDASVLSVMNVYLVLLLVVFVVNPSNYRPMFWSDVWEGLVSKFRYYEKIGDEDNKKEVKKQMKKNLRTYGKIHLIFAGIIFASIFAVEVLVFHYYYNQSTVGWTFLGIDMGLFVIFVILTGCHIGKSDMEKKMKKTQDDESDSGWPSHLDLCEIAYSLMFGFTLMFVRNPPQV